MTKVNPNNRNETKQAFFQVRTNKYRETKSHKTCANLTVFFFIHKVVQYLNDL